MRKFFNHLFYRIHWWNVKIVKDKDLPIFSTLMGFSVFIIINLSTIIFAFYIFIWKNPLDYPKIVHFIIMVSVVVINYLIFIHNRKYIQILEMAKSVEKKRIHLNDKLTILYIIITFSSVIWIVLQSRKASGIVDY